METENDTNLTNTAVAPGRTASERSNMDIIDEMKNHAKTASLHREVNRFNELNRSLRKISGETFVAQNSTTTQFFGDSFFDNGHTKNDENIENPTYCLTPLSNRPNCTFGRTVELFPPEKSPTIRS